MPTTSVRPPTATKLHPSRTDTTAISSFGAMRMGVGGRATAAARARATTAQNLTRLYLPLDLSLLLGGLIIPVNPSLRQRSSALDLGRQANPVPGPVTSSRYDDLGSSSGAPHNTNTIMRALGSAFGHTVSMRVATGMVALRADASKAHMMLVPRRQLQTQLI
ncbi:hypothetical protein M422DRAFT_246820 [Sphaerobolus stellatus SS14]|nr:hypothetical protein M422DRAFT_246820 [Sphaerobolus stellatus SS14]